MYQSQISLNEGQRDHAGKIGDGLLKSGQSVLILCRPTNQSFVAVSFTLDIGIVRQHWEVLIFVGFPRNDPLDAML